MPRDASGRVASRSTADAVGTFGNGMTVSEEAHFSFRGHAFVARSNVACSRPGSDPTEAVILAGGFRTGSCLGICVPLYADQQYRGGPKIPGATKFSLSKPQNA